jgi:hypothetical protein
VKEINFSAFITTVWRLAKFDGPTLLLMNDDFLCSADVRILLKFLSLVSDFRPLLIPAGH